MRSLRLFLSFFFLLLFLCPPQQVVAALMPVYVGLDAAFGLTGSTAAESIERGILIAIDEINREGGVLGGRPLRLISKDNRSVPSRGIRNLREFASTEDLVAFFVGRFSAVALEYVDLARDLEMILLDPWAPADAITRNEHTPNYAFRLALTDTLAIGAMCRYARGHGIERVGLLLPNTSWGRSTLNAAAHYYRDINQPGWAGTAWYQWGDLSLIEKYQSLRAAGSDAILFVGNESEGAILHREMSALPEGQRLPIISHWGVTGGNFAELVRSDLGKIDFSVVQSFSFFRAEPQMRARVLAIAHRLFGLERIDDIRSPVGMGHAYDLTHILARAIDMAGTTERPAIRNALEQVRNYRGLVRYFEQPFTADSHDALGPQDVFMATYRPDGALVPLPQGRQP